MSEPTTSVARERVLTTASILFRERGYQGVTLRDIAQALEISQPALYYHVPGGKEALFVEVMTRTFRRCHSAIEAILVTPAPHATHLYDIALWLLNEPPLDVVRLARSDLSAISSATAATLLRLGEESLALPLAGLFQSLQNAGSVMRGAPKVLVTGFLAMLDALHDLVPALSHEELARLVVAVFLRP